MKKKLLLILMLFISKLVFPQCNSSELIANYIIRNDNEFLFYRDYLPKYQKETDFLNKQKWSTEFIIVLYKNVNYHFAILLNDMTDLPCIKLEFYSEVDSLLFVLPEVSGQKYFIDFLCHKSGFYKIKIVYNCPINSFCHIPALFLRREKD